MPIGLEAIGVKMLDRLPNSDTELLPETVNFGFRPLLTMVADCEFHDIRLCLMLVVDQGRMAGDGDVTVPVGDAERGPRVALEIAYFIIVPPSNSS